MFLKEFWKCDSERSLGWAHGRIPASKIEDRGYRLGWPDDMVDLFTEVILAMDRAYLKYLQDERDKKQPGK